MTEYFGFEIEEGYKGEFNNLVDGVDPKYHRSIAWGLSQLCQWYGDKAYRELDEWFTIVYGIVMMVEDVHMKQLKPGVTKINYKDLVAKPVDPDQQELF